LKRKFLSFSNGSTSITNYNKFVYKKFEKGAYNPKSSKIADLDDQTYYYETKNIRISEQHQETKYNNLNRLSIEQQQKDFVFTQRTICQ